jgi:hypothetical protein
VAEDQKEDQKKEKLPGLKLRHRARYSTAEWLTGKLLTSNVPAEQGLPAPS